MPRAAAKVGWGHGRRNNRERWQTGSSLMRPMPTWKRALPVKMTFPARRTGRDGVTPLSIEFWQDGNHRLHDRLVYARPAPDWAWQPSAFILSLTLSQDLSAIGFGARKGETGLFQHARGGHGGFVAIGRADNLHADWQAGCVFQGTAVAGTRIKTPDPPKQHCRNKVAARHLRDFAS